MIICLDMVGRKSRTVGRADDERVVVEGRNALSFTVNTPLQVSSLQKTKMKQIRSFLRETLEKTHTLLPSCEYVTL